MIKAFTDRVQSRWVHGIVLAAIIAAFAVTAALAMRHTSTTFDELLLPAAGARGYRTGDFSLVIDHPRLLQYAYGLPIFFSDVQYPSETAYPWDYQSRYAYAQTFFWYSGNDPEVIAFRARLLGVLFGAMLIGCVYLITRRHAGRNAALMAALLVAFVPDVLGHSGVSYNDVPLALALTATIYVIDRAVRIPTVRMVVLAAFASAITIGVKFSGIIVGPILLVLLAVEALSGRWRDTAWWKQLAVGVPVYALVLYLMLVAVYLGEFSLAEFREGLAFNIRHANKGHGAPAVLLGRLSEDGWWYYFPVAFLLKTSAALHLLGALACYGAARAISGQRWRELLRSDYRAPIIGGAVFLASALAASLNIGFRHAMPLLPLVCILVACGVAALWSRAGRVVRVAIVVLLAWHTIAPMRAYPYFISYLSEYTGPLDDSYDTLVDSSRDWGQGLLALRDYMRDKKIDRVYLSYFGSALPAGYGIDYVPLYSFYPLPPTATGATPPPKYLAISATNLTGNYFTNDPFARFRELRPDTVLARSIWIYELSE